MYKKTQMKSLLIVAILSISSCKQPPSQDDVITEQEALDFIQKYDVAWNSKDSVTVNNLLGNSYLYFDSKGGLTTRQRTVEIVGAPYYRVLSAKRSKIEVFTHGNVATVSSHWVG